MKLPNVGVKKDVRKTQPGSFFALSVRVTRSASVAFAASGVPMISNGRVVPRPSLTPLTFSKMPMPGYTTAVPSHVGMLGDGITQGRPSCSHRAFRLYPGIFTTCSRSPSFGSIHSASTSFAISVDSLVGCSWWPVSNTAAATATAVRDKTTNLRLSCRGAWEGPTLRRATCGR